jgi:transcriptional regulator with XRE-family HTH domain
MNSFFDDLRSAREASGISLAEIADATLINIKMLEALERGHVEVVPQPYIRAFIREYATVIGLDPAETLKRYDGWLGVREEQNRKERGQLRSGSLHDRAPARKENERRAGIDETLPPPHNTVLPKDSMTLAAVTTDSVWMQIVVDDSLQQEHLFYPRTTFRWKARKDFLLVAIGNPSAIRFTLNDKPLTLPFKRGLVARNIRVTRDSLHTR